MKDFFKDIFMKNPMFSVAIVQLVMAGLYRATVYFGLLAHIPTVQIYLLASAAAAALLAGTIELARRI